MQLTGPYLGIDAGGTSTQAVLIAADGSVLGYGEAGAGNHTTVGVEKARESVVRAVRAALSSAGTLPVAVAFGSAGLEQPGDPAVARRLLPDELHSCPLVFDTDALIALEGALGGQPGIVVAAGTGAIAFGRDVHGDRAYASGWGWRIGDEGSAHWIGSCALNAVTKALDGRGPKTMLTELIMDRLRIESAQGLVDWTYHPSREPSEIADLASAADCAANAGDEVALRILERAADELADAAQAVFERSANDWDLPVPVAYTGGVFRSQLLTRAFQQALQARGWGVARAPLLDPVWGAALLAWRFGRALASGAELWSVKIPEELLEALRTGSERQSVQTRY